MAERTTSAEDTQNQHCQCVHTNVDRISHLGTTHPDDSDTVRRDRLPEFCLDANSTFLGEALCTATND